MSLEHLDFAEPFFDVKHIENLSTHHIEGRAIVLNLSDQPIQVEAQEITYLQSNIVADITLQNVQRAVLIERFDAHDDDATLFEQVKQHWPSAYEVRKEERLRGVSHYMSPKVWVRNIGLTMYHSGSVPLKVGLHKFHPFCEEPGFKEVHTQIVGVGKMQQCREQDINTLYWEETMAPGTTHRPMYDAEGNFPWHQYETITPAIFMAVEILPNAPQEVVA